MSLYRPVKIGSLELNGNLFLAPVAGYTDRAFRSICAEEGADFSFTELVSAEAVSRNVSRYGLGSVAEGGNAPLHAVSVNLIRRTDGILKDALPLIDTAAFTGATACGIFS